MPALRSDRWFISGATGSGKSYFARRLFESMAPPRAVIDPKDDPEATGGMFRDRRLAVSFADPARLPDADVIRFVPRDPMDMDAYDAVYRSLFDRRGVVVWTDEAGMVFPARGAVPRGAARLVTQGRRWGIGHIALHQRPIEVAKLIGANAEQVVSFHLGLDEDIDTVAKRMQIPRAELAGELVKLPKHGFAWYSARERTLTTCPPVG